MSPQAMGSIARKAIATGLTALTVKLGIQDQSWIAPMAAGTAGFLVVLYDWAQSSSANLAKRALVSPGIAAIETSDGEVHTDPNSITPANLKTKK